MISKQENRILHTSNYFPFPSFVHKPTQRKGKYTVRASPTGLAIFLFILESLIRTPYLAKEVKRLIPEVLPEESNPS